MTTRQSAAADDLAEAAESAEESEIIQHLLMRPGPFTTPRAVYRSIRFSMRPKAKEKLPDIIKKLELEGLGSFLQFSSTESVYYKPKPTNNNEEKVTAYLKNNTWKDYCDAINKKDTLISAAQYTRLIAKAPV